MYNNKSILAKIFVMKRSDFFLMMVFYSAFMCLLYFFGRAKALEKDVLVLENTVDSLNNELIIRKLEKDYIFEHSSIK